MENKQVKEIRSSIESSIKSGMVKGNISNSKIELPLEQVITANKLNQGNSVWAFVFFMAFIIYTFHAYLTNDFWGISNTIISSILFILILVFHFSGMIVRKILVIDFNSKKIFFANSIFGKHVGSNKLIVLFSDIAGFAINTIPIRKSVSTKYGSHPMRVDHRIVKSRDFSAFSKFINFYSNLFVYKRDGRKIDIFPDSVLEEDFDSMNLIGSSLSEAFGVPFTACPKNKKLSFEKNGEISLIPVFSEKECLDMEKER